MSHLPKTSCCRSTPRCGRCPVRLALEARARGSWDARAALVHEVLRGVPAPLPRSVEEALATLEQARDGTRREPARAIL